MFDEGQKLAHPYHRTKFESEKLVRERVKAPWRVYRPSVVVGNSNTGEMDKIDGPVLLLQGDPEGPPRAAGVVPAGLARVGLDEHRAGRLRRRGDRPHRPPGRPRRPGLPRRRPQGPARRRGAEHVRRRRPRAASGRARIDKRVDAEPAQGRAQLRDEAAGAQADPRAACSPTSGSRTRSSTTSRSPAASTRATRSARCAARTSSSPPLDELRREAVGLLGAHARPGPLQGPLVRGRRQRQDGRDHRRLVGHRPRRRAEDRRRRRDPDPRRAHEGEARRGQGARSRPRAAPRTSHSCDLSRLRRDRARSSRRCSPTTRGSTCSSTTRAARSGARSRSPTTASTTTSARSTSTTSPP